MRTVTTEQLEPRRLLTAAVVADFTVDLSFDNATVATAVTVDLPAGSCPPQVARAASQQRLPAPIVADFNLDGFFTSEDLVAFYSDPTRPQQTDSTSIAARIVDEFDLIGSIQWVPYEADTPLSTANPCFIYDLAAKSDPTSVRRDDVRDVGSDALRKSTIRIGAANQPLYRAALYFDRAERLRTFTVGLYGARPGVIYSRLLSEYDAEGRLLNHSTWVHYDSGDIRRTTKTTFWHVNDQTFKSTAVEQYNLAGQMTSRRIHYYDDSAHEVSATYNRYDASGGSSISKTQADTRVLSVTNSTPTNSSPVSDTYVPVESPLSYLVTLHQEYESTVDAMGEAYREVLRMTPLPAQQHLELILNDGRLTSAEKDRFRKLNQYFELSIDVAKSLQFDDVEPLYLKYSDLIDANTGEWRAAFQAFVKQERLALPFAPMQQVEDPHDQNPYKQADLAARY